MIKRRIQGLAFVLVIITLLGLSVAETAAELRIAEGTVKSHSSRGV